VVRAEVVDFWAVVFNPSFVNRLVHTLIGCYLMGAFFVMSISAFYLLKRKHEEFARRSFTGALLFATVFSLAQLVSGDFNARMVANQQPAKLAALEGHFQTGAAGLTLAGIPDAASAQTLHRIEIPGLLSWLIYGDASHPVLGLDKFAREYWPPVLATFTVYHLMVGIGMFFIALTLYASFLRWQNRLFENRALLWVFVGAVVLAVAGNQLGWITAEVGRQPWVVFPRIERDAGGAIQFDEKGLVRYRMEEGLLTRDAVSEAVSAPQVLGSILLFALIYGLLGSVWVMVLHLKIRAGPEPWEERSETSLAKVWEVAGERLAHTDSLTERE
jgi:cytochrome d ubiquinol oxidase subunit I